MVNFPGALAPVGQRGPSKSAATRFSNDQRRAAASGMSNASAASTLQPISHVVRAPQTTPTQVPQAPQGMPARQLPLPQVPQVPQVPTGGQEFSQADTVKNNIDLEQFIRSPGVQTVMSTVHLANYWRSKSDPAYKPDDGLLSQEVLARLGAIK